MQYEEDLLIVAWFFLVSIACLERLHALSRRILLASKTSFTVFSGSFVVARRRGTFLRAQGFMLAAANVECSAALEYGALQINLRAESALEVFRRRKSIACVGDLQEDGQRFNPIVHAGAIQDAFAAADSEERHLCAAISKWSKVLAEDGRFLCRATSTAEVVAATAATSTVVSALLLRRSEMIVRPTDQCFALVLKQPEDDTHLTVLPWRQSDMGLLNAAAHPWSTALLQDFIRGPWLAEKK